MTKNLAKWPSGHGQLTKIWLSDRCGGKTLPMVLGFGYDHHGFEGYLGNVGLYRKLRVKAKGRSDTMKKQSSLSAVEVEVLEFWEDMLPIDLIRLHKRLLPDSVRLPK